MTRIFSQCYLYIILDTPSLVQRKFLCRLCSFPVNSIYYNILYNIISQHINPFCLFILDHFQPSCLMFLHCSLLSDVAVSVTSIGVCTLIFRMSLWVPCWLETVLSFSINLWLLLINSLLIIMTS